MVHKIKKGGKNTSLQPAPIILNGYKHGNDPRNNALRFQTSQDNMQNNLNSIHGGMRKHTKSKKHHKNSRKQHKKTRRSKKGGNGGCAGRPKTAVVPSFGQVGPQVSSVTNNNTASVNNNQMKINSTNDAQRDGYAFTNTIPTIGGSKKKAIKGRKGRRTRRAGKRGVKWGCYSGGSKKFIRHTVKNLIRNSFRMRDNQGSYFPITNSSSASPFSS